TSGGSGAAPPWWKLSKAAVPAARSVCVRSSCRTCAEAISSCSAKPAAAFFTTIRRSASNTSWPRRLAESDPPSHSLRPLSRNRKTVHLVKESESSVALTRILAFILTGVLLAANGHTTAGTDTLDDLFVRDYIRELGHQLAKRLPGDERSWEFEVIRENQGGSTHEPMAIPERHIFVPAALILAVENEAELAGMLAHSMAHVAAGAGVDCAVIPGTAHGMSVLLSSQDLETRRTCELEADRTAVKTVSAAGYDPIGLLEYIRRTQSPATGRSNTYSMLPPR